MAEERRFHLPTLPFSHEVGAEACGIGSQLSVRGTPYDDERRRMNVVLGATRPGDAALDLALHLPGKSGRGNLSVHSRVNNTQSSVLERDISSVSVNKEFVLAIVVKEHALEISVDGAFALSFVHRIPPHEIRYVNVDGPFICNEVVMVPPPQKDMPRLPTYDELPNSTRTVQPTQLAPQAQLPTSQISYAIPPTGNTTNPARVEVPSYYNAGGSSSGPRSSIPISSSTPPIPPPISSIPHPAAATLPSPSTIPYGFPPVVTQQQPSNSGATSMGQAGAYSSSPSQGMPQPQPVVQNKPPYPEPESPIGIKPIPGAPYPYPAPPSVDNSSSPYPRATPPVQPPINAAYNQQAAPSGGSLYPGQNPPSSQLRYSPSAATPPNAPPSAYPGQSSTPPTGYPQQNYPYPQQSLPNALPGQPQPQPPMYPQAPSPMYPQQTPPPPSMYSGTPPPPSAPTFVPSMTEPPPPSGAVTLTNTMAGQLPPQGYPHNPYGTVQPMQPYPGSGYVQYPPQQMYYSQQPYIQPAYGGVIYSDCHHHHHHC